MSILNDQEIQELCEAGMITGWTGRQVRHLKGNHRVISYGLSSFGYDIRLAGPYKIFTNINAGIVDPKDFTDTCLHEIEDGDRIIIPPNSFMLARSHEFFSMPEDVVAVCLGKSTYARCGIIVNVTPIEPGWEGYITLEFSNTTPLPVAMYPGEGCAQLMFFRGYRPDTTYSDRNGKYMNQGPRPVYPKV